MIGLNPQKFYLNSLEYQNFTSGTWKIFGHEPSEYVNYPMNQSFSYDSGVVIESGLKFINKDVSSRYINVD